MWRSNQLSYRTGEFRSGLTAPSFVPSERARFFLFLFCISKFHLQQTSALTRVRSVSSTLLPISAFTFLQKGGVPAAPSGTATLLRLSPNHQFYPRPPLAVTDFRHSRLSWLDGRCVQGPGTYSPRHGPNSLFLRQPNHWRILIIRSSVNGLVLQRIITARGI